MHPQLNIMAKNIGFVSTRFFGQDGVSLESAKWADVLWKEGYTSFWYSGLNDRNDDISYVVPEAYFGSDENEKINELIWDGTSRSKQTTLRIHKLANKLKQSLYDFVEKFDIDILIPQNCLAIPMHLPLGIAVTEFLSETKMPAIAHHHDFFGNELGFR